MTSPDSKNPDPEQPCPNESAESFVGEPKSQFQMGVEAETVLRLGVLMTGAGASGYRVIRAMKRTARALGFDGLDAIVGVTQITCTFHRGHHFRTVIARSEHLTVDASRIEALEDMTHHYDHLATAAEINAQIDVIEENVKKRWKPPVLALAAGIACACFAILNLFSFAEAGLVAVAAALGQLTRSALLKRHFHTLGTVAISASVAALCFFSMSETIDHFYPGTGENLSAGYVAAALFLVPGFPLFSSMIDLARFDFDAGLARLTYAAVVTFTATFAVSMISWATGLNPKPVLGEKDLTWYLVAAFASFLGICGFALLFNASKRMILVAAAVGTIANMLRFALLAAGANQFFALFVAGLAIGVIGCYAAQFQGLPRVTTTVPASVILIPGVALFRGMYFLNSGDMNAWLAQTATAIMAILSIAAGLTLARMLTDDAWTFGRYIEFERWQREHGVHH